MKNMMRFFQDLILASARTKIICSFQIDSGVPVTGKLSSSEILGKVLHPDQNDDSEDNESTEENISNSRCIELT